MPEKLPHHNALDTRAEVPGYLQQWLRTGGGEWLGLVDYEVPFADGRKKGVYLTQQLLPAHALRPRKSGA